MIEWYPKMENSIKAFSAYLTETIFINKTFLIFMILAKMIMPFSAHQWIPSEYVL